MKNVQIRGMSRANAEAKARQILPGYCRAVKISASKNFTMEIILDSFDGLKNNNIASWSSVIDMATGYRAIFTIAPTKQTVEDKLRGLLKENMPVKFNYDTANKKIELTYFGNVDKKTIQDLVRCETGIGCRINVECKKEPAVQAEAPAKQVFYSFKALADDMQAKKTDYIRGIGGCQRIGNSSFLVKLENLVLLLDCGLDLDSSNPPALTKAEIKSIDYIIASHAHEDHIGAIPWLYKEGCAAKIICTQPTKEIAEILWHDYLKISGESLFSRNDVATALQNTITRNYAESMNLSKLKLTLQNAGHILGSSIVCLEHNGKNIVYTGDFAMHNSLLKGAVIPDKIDVLITETTYGNSCFKSYQSRKNEMMKKIKTTIDRNGTVLIPSFAAGRGQEIEHILYENREMLDCEVYVDGMIRKVNSVYANDSGQKISHSIREDFRQMSKFFTEIDHYTMREDVCFDSKPKIIVTTSGMMTGGPVLMYLPHLCEERKNLILLVGYQAQDTLGRQLLNGKSESSTGRSNEFEFKLGLRDYTHNAELGIVHLSGHADKNQLMSAFLKKQIEKIIAVHGEGDNISSFVQYASQKFKAKQVCALAPGQEIDL